MLKNTEEAREYFKNNNLSYSDLNQANLQQLRKFINNKMIDSKCIHGTFRCHQRPKINKNNMYVHNAFIECRSHYFENREAVSFNHDGFIGFAGWSDSKNIRPILDGFEEWVDWMINYRRG